MDLQGGSDIWLQGSPGARKLQPAAGGKKIQSTYDPMAAGSFGGGGGGGGGAQTSPVGDPNAGGGAGGYGAGGGAPVNEYADDVVSLRAQIRDRRARANTIFAQLTNAVQDVAADKSKMIGGQYESQFGDITQNQADTQNQLTGAYGGRGLLNSSFLINAQDRAAQEAQGAIGKLGQARDSSLAEIGQYVSEKLAGIKETRANVNDRRQIRDLLENGTPEQQFEALTKIRNDMEETLSKLRVQLAGTKTQSGFKGVLGRAIPGLGNFAGSVKSALGALVKAAIPQRVKDTIASGIIQGSGSPEEEALWKKYYDDQVNKSTTTPAEETG